MLIGGGVLWFILCAALPEANAGVENRFLSGALGTAGFLFAGLMWWGWARVPWQRKWIVPTLVTLAVVLEFFSNGSRYLVAFRGALEYAAGFLPWQIGFQELSNGGVAGGFALCALMTAAEALWIRWNHSRVRELFRFDRLDEEIYYVDEEIEDYDDLDEMDEFVEYGLNYDAFSPPQPGKLPLLERVLWRWLSEEQRWLANLGGIGDGNFLKRLGYALLFVVFAILTVTFANSFVASAFGSKAQGLSLRTTIQFLEIVQVILGGACVFLALVSSLVSDGDVLEYWVTLGVVATVLIVLTGLMVALIRWRLRSPRCDLVIAASPIPAGAIKLPKCPINWENCLSDCLRSPKYSYLGIFSALQSSVRNSPTIAFGADCFGGG